MVYMKGQVVNSNCVRKCESEWMNEWACKWIDCLRKWEKILKDGQISLRSSKAIFDHERSSGVE